MEMYEWLTDKLKCEVVLAPIGPHKGLIVPQGDGYLIMINDGISRDRQLMTLSHELMHVILGHQSERHYLTLAEKEYEVEYFLRRHK